MLVVGPLFQITAFLIQFLELPFPIFALSYSISGIGTVFQVSIKKLNICVKNCKSNNASSNFDFVLLGCIREWLHRDSSKRL